MHTFLERNWKAKKAFTLIETLIVLTLIVIVWIIAFINFGSQQPKARDSMREDVSSKIRLSYSAAVSSEWFNHSTCEEVWAITVSYSWQINKGCNIKLDWSSTGTLFLNSLWITWIIKDPNSNETGSQNPDYEFTYLKNSITHEFAYVRETPLHGTTSSLNSMKSYALNYDSWSLLTIEWNYVPNTMSWFYIITPVIPLDWSVLLFPQNVIETNSWYTIISSDKNVYWTYSNYLSLMVDTSSWSSRPSISDITPPITTSEPSISTAASGTTVSITQTINKTGTGYYLILQSWSPVPSISSVKEGTAFEMTGGIPSIVNITGLTEKTSYTYYFIATDSNHNTQNSVSTWLSFLTIDVSAPVFVQSPFISTPETASTVSISQTINEDGTGFYLWLVSTAPTPSISDVMNRTAISITWNSSKIVNISGLLENTWYKYYFIAEDNLWHIQNSLTSLSFHTTDVTAPLTTVSPFISTAATSTTVSISQTINENWTWYFYILPSGSWAPSVSTVISSWISFSMLNWTPAIKNISWLSEKTSYKYYFIAKDSSWNIQASVSTGLLITTRDITPPTLTQSPTISVPATSTTISISQTINEDWLWYYVILPSASAAPDIATVKLGTVFAMTANSIAINWITGLTENTRYKYYFIAMDSSNNTQLSISSLSFHTTDITPPVLTSSPSISTQPTTTTISITQTINESWTWYYIVQPSISYSTPSISTMLNSWIAFSMSSNSWSIVNITWLSENTSYVYSFIAQDLSWNVQSSISEINFSTVDITPPVTITTPYVSTAATATTISITQRINETGTGYYLILSAASGAPSVATVKAGTAFSMTTVPYVLNITGLTENTAYKYYFVAADTSWNTQTSVSTWLAITTADITPPTTTSAPSISTIARGTTVSVTQTINETWTGYYYILPSASAAPSVSTVTTSWTAFAMATNSATIVNVTGLTSQTSYKYYFVAKDTSWNVQTVVSTWLPFTTTDITPPITTSAPAIAVAASWTTVAITQTINEAGLWYYIVQPAANSAPSVSTVLAGSNFWMLANDPTSIYITWLTSWTAYKYYFIAMDSSWNAQTSVSTGLAFTTTDITPPTTTSAPAISTAATRTTVSITQTINESGTWYYYLLPSASSTPSVSTVTTSWTAFAMASNSATIVNIIGLTASSSYKYYFVAKDSSWNIQSSVSTGLAITTLTNYIQIAAGLNFSIFTLSNWSVKAVWFNNVWQLGIWTTTNQYWSLGNSWLTWVKSVIATQYRSSYYLMNDWTVKATWRNWDWQLGQGNTTNLSTPLAISWLTNVTQIAAWSYDTYFLLNDWTVKAVWSNWYGGMGLWNTTPHTSPISLSLTWVAQIAAWNYHTLFLMNDWTVKSAWYNGQWQLWNWTTTSTSSLVTVLWISNVKQVSAWLNFSLFLMNDWTVKAVWDNSLGALWNWNFTNQSTPVSVTGLTWVSQIAAWNLHSLFLMNDWTVKAVWSDSYYELWDGLSTEQNTVVSISWLSNVKQIAAWLEFDLFLLNDWTVKVLWKNTNYQLWQSLNNSISSLTTISWLNLN